MTPQCSFTGGHPLSDYESEASDLLNPKLFSSFWIWSDRPLCSTFLLNDVLHVSVSLLLDSTKGSPYSDDDLAPGAQQ